LVLVHLRSNSKREDQNSGVLGVVGNSVESIGVHVVGSIGHHNHDWNNSVLSPSSKADEFPVSKVHTTSNASRALSLEHGIHRIEERSLRVCNVDSKPGISTELHQSHSHLIGSKSVGSSKVSAKVDSSSEIVGSNRTRLIKHQHKVNLFVTNWSGTVPSIDHIEGIGIQSSHTSEVHHTSIRKLHSADCVSIGPNSRDGVGINVEERTCLSSDILGCSAV